jgi:hypothetical protein
MAINNYRDFILVADDVEKEGAPVRRFTVSVFDSPVGQGEKKEIVTVPAGTVQKIRELEARALDEAVDRQIELGEILAGLLLPTYARQMFARSLARLRDGEGLRLRLRLADELADFPWEYIYIDDARGDERSSSNFLALDPGISIVRHEAIAVPSDWFDTPTPSKRRIVVAMATPEPYEIYPKLKKLPEEQAALKEALDEVDGVAVDFVPEYADDPGSPLPGATLEDLGIALMDHVDVFHFSGHGTFYKKAGQAFGTVVGEGGIILAGKGNQGIAVPADRFAEMLHSRGVRLVVLGACETGRRDGHNVWSSVAASLLKAGIPAVVAMQFTVKDALAAAFSAALYRGLVAGLTVDEAVAMGRAAIRRRAHNGNRDVRDWGVPVLYLRAPGGRVFNPVSDEQAVEAAEEQLGHLFEQQVREVASEGRMIGPVIGSMQEETVTVGQMVDERVSGLVLGSYVFSLQSGQLVVRQKADVVEGTMVGTVISHLGGEPPMTKDAEVEALDKMREWLGVTGLCVQCGKEVSAGTELCDECGAPAPTGPTCPSCGEPVTADHQFCPSCGTPLPAGSSYCPHCGKETQVGARFCHHCGKKIA